MASKMTIRKNRRKTMKHKQSKSRKHIRNKIKGGNKPVIMGYIYAEWCGYCDKFKNTWKALCDSDKNKTKQKLVIELGKVNSDPEVLNINKKKVLITEPDGVPHIFKIENGKKHVHLGEHTEEAIQKWLNTRQQ
jgi:thiol-disulfide isomerase/thioredoxin